MSLLAVWQWFVYGRSETILHGKQILSRPDVAELPHTEQWQVLLNCGLSPAEAQQVFQAAAVAKLVESLKKRSCLLVIVSVLIFLAAAKTLRRAGLLMTDVPDPNWPHESSEWSHQLNSFPAEIAITREHGALLLETLEASPLKLWLKPVIAECQKLVEDADLLRGATHPAYHAADAWESTKRLVTVTRRDTISQAHGLQLFLLQIEAVWTAYASAFVRQMEPFERVAERWEGVREMLRSKRAEALDGLRQANHEVEKARAVWWISPGAWTLGRNRRTANALENVAEWKEKSEGVVAIIITLGSTSPATRFKRTVIDIGHGYYEDVMRMFQHISSAKRDVKILPSSSWTSAHYELASSIVDGINFHAARLRINGTVTLRGTIACQTGTIVFDKETVFVVKSAIIVYSYPWFIFNEKASYLFVNKDKSHAMKPIIDCAFPYVKDRTTRQFRRCQIPVVGGFEYCHIHQEMIAKVDELSEKADSGAQPAESSIESSSEIDNQHNYERPASSSASGISSPNCTDLSSHHNQPNTLVNEPVGRFVGTNTKVQQADPQPVISNFEKAFYQCTADAEAVVRAKAHLKKLERKFGESHGEYMEAFDLLTEAGGQNVINAFLLDREKVARTT